MDAVAANFIQGNVDNIEINNNTSTISTKNTYGLHNDQFVTINYNDSLTDNRYMDGKKFKIIELTDNSIIVNGIIDGDEVNSNYKVFWCQAKDDVTPDDIFRLQEGSSSDRAIVAKYCIQDSVLCNKLMTKLQIITNNVGMANVCNVPLSYLFLRGQGIKIYSLVTKMCRQFKFLVPCI